MHAAPLRELIVATKSHVDIGFTEPEAKVLHDACRWLLPLAVSRIPRSNVIGCLIRHIDPDHTHREIPGRCFLGGPEILGGKREGARQEQR